MVEIAEIANILYYGSDRSLVLLDEIGRGTFDGLSNRLSRERTPSRRSGQPQRVRCPSSRAQQPERDNMDNFQELVAPATAMASRQHD